MVDLNLSSGLPETILPPEPQDVLERLAATEQLPAEDQAAAIRTVVADYPDSITGWAALGTATDDPVHAYAAYRVGYHRGLDALRKNGWRGSGYVRWVNETNQGFMRALAGLARLAAVIGEDHEAERCEIFLRQLDPGWRSDFVSSDL